MKTFRIPFVFGADGSVASVDGEYGVARAHLHSLIVTQFGERVMRPELGSSTYASLFESADEVLTAQLEADLNDAVQRWLPDVELVAVNFQILESRVEVEVLFTLRSTFTETPAMVNVVIDSGGQAEEFGG